MSSNNNSPTTKVRVIYAGEKEDRVIYDWGNGYRLRIDKYGFGLFHNGVLVKHTEVSPWLKQDYPS